ncbi:hypothetical protein [Noviherbaspirillum malthae]|uniref:hypothetical protein n=1 Tax=Noviherbaspirillum malthae TaxID=1260987 RepID=UPI00188DE6BA|nr:hypothetical protein [Noviherbaspirillum malthae]
MIDWSFYWPIVLGAIIGWVIFIWSWMTVPIVGVVTVLGYKAFGLAITLWLLSLPLAGMLVPFTVVAALVAFGGTLIIWRCR